MEPSSSWCKLALGGAELSSQTKAALTRIWLVGSNEQRLHRLKRAVQDRTNHQSSNMAVEQVARGVTSPGCKLFSLHGLQQGVGLASVALGWRNRPG